GVSSRASWSELPPAENGTTIFTGLTGQSCACAGAARAAHSKTASRNRDGMGRLTPVGLRPQYRELPLDCRPRLSVAIPAQPPDCRPRANLPVLCPHTPSVVVAAQPLDCRPREGGDPYAAATQ